MCTTEVQISKKRSEESQKTSDKVNGRSWEISAEGYIPSPKKKYGFDMANNGPYLAHTWNRYGKVRPLYGTDMGPSFVTFQGMGRVWVF